MVNSHTNKPFYLNDFIRAVGNVSNEYCLWNYKSEKYLQKIERVFSYELYYQFKNIIKDNSQYNNLRFDGEIHKHFSNAINNCGTSYTFKQVRFSPDFVLHCGQIGRSSSSQKLVVETKVRAVGKEQFVKTILKLNHYICHLNFQHAVFLSVNTNPNVITSKLRKYFCAKNSCANNFKRIIIISYQKGTLLSNTLYNILNNYEMEQQLLSNKQQSTNS